MGRIRSTIRVPEEDVAALDDQEDQIPQEEQVSPAPQTPQALAIIQALEARHKACQVRQAQQAPTSAVGLPGGLDTGLAVDHEHEAARRAHEGGPARTPGNYAQKAESIDDWQAQEIADLATYQREQDALVKLKANQGRAARAREALRVKREVVKAQKLEAKKAQTRKASEALATKRAKRSITS